MWLLMTTTATAMATMEAKTVASILHKSENGNAAVRNENRWASDGMVVWCLVCLCVHVLGETTVADTKPIQMEIS